MKKCKIGLSTIILILCGIAYISATIYEQYFLPDECLQHIAFKKASGTIGGLHTYSTVVAIYTIFYKIWKRLPSE